MNKPCVSLPRKSFTTYLLEPEARNDTITHIHLADRDRRASDSCAPGAGGISPIPESIQLEFWVCRNMVRHEAASDMGLDG